MLPDLMLNFRVVLQDFRDVLQDLGVPRRAIHRLDPGRDGDDHGRDGDARRDTQFSGNGRLAASATPIQSPKPSKNHTEKVLLR